MVSRIPRTINVSAYRQRFLMPKPTSDPNATPVSMVLVQHRFEQQTASEWRVTRLHQSPPIRRSQDAIGFQPALLW
jgi:hypothetical protein